MALKKTNFLKLNHHFPPFSFHPSPTQMSLQFSPTTRRAAALLPMLSTSTLLPILPLSSKNRKGEANAMDLRVTVPDQTVEEAENGIQFHSQSLLQVKELLELESWKDAQRELRKSSALLKQDLYTIIQSKPGIQRPQLRNLYSILFNSVTTLDYAARDKDVTRVRECYDNIVVALNNILSLL